MKRTVSAYLDLRLDGPTDLIFSLAVARGSYEVEESFVVTLDGEPLQLHEIEARHGNRLHRASAAAGDMVVRYEATVTGQADADEPTELELIEYLRPSRYSEADSLGSIARAEFGRLSGMPALAAVEAWVNSRLTYAPWTSVATRGAEGTLQVGTGVCRDFAHTVVALLRALDIPARVAAVYAPGLSPMDLHAVSEAWVDGAWHVVDATRLAPRGTLLRISAGRDTADTAFLSSYGTDLRLRTIGITASVDEAVADDFVSAAVIR